MVQLVEEAWRQNGLEPNQPTRSHDERMLVLDYFQSFGMQMNGGYWDNPKEYFDKTEELGVRVYGSNGGINAYQFLEKMAGFQKYIQPIFDSQIKFDAILETMRKTLNDKGSTALLDLDQVMNMVRTSEEPWRRIGKQDFFNLLK